MVVLTGHLGEPVRGVREGVHGVAGVWGGRRRDVDVAAEFAKRSAKSCMTRVVTHRESPDELPMSTKERSELLLPAAAAAAW